VLSDEDEDAGWSELSVGTDGPLIAGYRIMMYESNERDAAAAGTDSLRSCDVLHTDYTPFTHAIS